MSICAGFDAVTEAGQLSVLDLMQCAGFDAVTEAGQLSVLDLIQ